jgi:predicted ribosomally synthesized peptide with nif11-like leader
MSQKSFSEFSAKLSADEALRQELARALGSNGTPEALAAFAKERGYDIDPDEIKGALGELSDDELDSVGGGTARLMQACVKGEHIKEVVIEM